MVILHIAAIKNNPFNGVCVVVPEYLETQKSYAEIGFININNEEIDGVQNRFEYKKPFNLSSLPSPFNKPDLVVFQEAYRGDYLSIAKVLRKNNIPYVIVPHGELTEFAQKKKRIKKLSANLLLFNRFTKKALAIQCLSAKELDTTHFGKRKFIGTNGVRMPLVKKESFREGGIRFVYIGRLEVTIKGLDIMIAAFSLKKELLKREGCELSIYGPDLCGRYAEVESLIEKYDVGDIVHLNHEISGKDKENALLDSDVFIQTSRTEGMPLGILEAMSYGLPVLITEGTRLSDTVAEANSGWTATTDVKAVAEAIERAVIERTTLKEKSSNAVSCIQKSFSWDHISKNTVKSYQELVFSKDK